MKVMICGGVKTKNIQSALQNRFKHGEISTVVVNSIDGLEELLNRGEYIDRAVVFEQGITQDGKITDEFSVRDRVCNFVNVVSTMLSREVTTIFVVQSEDLAKIVAEESMELGAQCRVLVKQPQYTIAFMARLVSFNIELIEPESVYKIRSSEPEEQEDRVIYSTYEDNSEIGEELKPVREIDFNDILDVSKESVDKEDESDNNFDGHKVTDFDSELFGTTSDHSMKNFDDMDEDFKDNKDGKIENQEAMKLDDREVEDDIDLESLFGNGEEDAHENKQREKVKSFYTDGFDIEEIGGPSSRGYEIEGTEHEDYLEQRGIMDTKKGNIEFDKEQIKMEDEPKKIGGNLWEEDEEPEYIEQDTPSDESMLDFDKETSVTGLESLFDDGFDEEFDGNSSKEHSLEFGKETAGLRITDDDTDEDLDGGIEDPFAIDDEHFDEMHRQEERRIQNIGNLFEQDDEDMYDEDDAIGSKIDVSKAEEMLDIDERSPRESKQDNEDGLYVDHLGMKQEQFDNEQNQFIGESNNTEKRGGFGKKNKKDKNLPIPMETASTRKAEEDLKKILNTFKNRGTSIVVTGTNCSGKSVTAYNIANIVTKLGYTALIVDMDTVNRAQAYISSDAYDAVHSLDPENPSLKQALNATNMGVSKYASIVRPGFHILTMGLAGDIVKGEKLAPRQKLARFGSNVRNNYNVVIYDMPFDVATEYAEDITYTADHILITCEASNHGLMNLMLAMCNIEREDMQETMFAHSQLCLTKYIELKKVFGQDIKNVRQGLLRIDREVQDLLGVDPEFYFSSMPVCGIMRFNSDYEDSWFSKNAYSDTRHGRGEYVDLLTKMFSR